ncbi:hypothetical protein ACFE04_003003 [Oxalis oulophora]
MAVKLPPHHHHNHTFLSSSSSNPWLPRNSVKTRASYKRAYDLNCLRRLCLARLAFLDNVNNILNQKSIQRRNNFSSRRRRQHCIIPHASTDDNSIAVNGRPQSSIATSTDVEKMSVRVNKSLQGPDSDDLVQSIHDAARVFELAIKEQGSMSKLVWFSAAWLGVDTNAWVKPLAYQAAVYALLQAASEIASRGEGRDRDSASLEGLIRDNLSARQPQAYEWFWSEQVPVVVTSFVKYFEEDPSFVAATSMGGKGISLISGNDSDVALIMLALTCIASVTKLGPAKVSCSQFFSMIPEITGKLMDMLVEFVSIRQAYESIKDIGLRREFLVHFGPRAAACRVKNDGSSEEVMFWVDLVQNQLQRAIDREKIWSRLTTSESIEVLDRDLAIFGFFIALGRSTQSFLFANGFDVSDNPFESLIRYFIGGSVLCYPQLSAISSYQLYVEVVCEELDWLPFYPGSNEASKQSHGHQSRQEGPPNSEAIPQVLDTCSHWMQSFIKYSQWLENPSNVKAARFLSKGHKKLTKCMDRLGISTNEITEINNRNYVEGRSTRSKTDKDSDSFDKALESVDEAVIRLEKLLQDLHVSSSNSGKEQLKAACSDLEKIRKLKKEAEFLAASFRAKTASLQQGDDGNEQKYAGKTSKRAYKMIDQSNNKPRGTWSFFKGLTSKQPEIQQSPAGRSKSHGNEFDETTSSTTIADLESSEVRRFELLRNELIELEKRVQRSADQAQDEEDVKASYSDGGESLQLVHSPKKNVIEKSIEKLKETSTDVWQGTQLLAIDTVAATGLLRRAIVGDELANKEKKALQRTLTDLASVVPIGVLMLLPVTAVGHAAMLAAIQRYVPALIPSTYGPERLDLLRKLEKVKEMDACETNPEEKD